MFASPQLPNFSSITSPGSSFNITPLRNQTQNQSTSFGGSFNVSSVPSPIVLNNNNNNATSVGGLMSMSTPTQPTPVAIAPIGNRSPVFQSPSQNKFPTAGGPVVFTPTQNATASGAGISRPAPASPYGAYTGSASSFIQSPLGGGIGGVGGSGTPLGYQGGVPPVVYTQSPYSSTMISGQAIGVGLGPSNIPVSPIVHGYGSPLQVGGNVAAVQQLGSYGARTMGASYGFHQGYSPTSYGHHSREDVVVEPMHCSPISGQSQTHPAGSPQYHPLHNRNPNSPPRPQYLPAYLTGVDVVAAVPTRPRRVFERSPSTSPPIMGVGGKSPTKSQHWGHAHDSAQQIMSGDQGEIVPGGYTRRSLGQGPSRQLRFADTSHLQNTVDQTEEKDKPKKSGPPTQGFGFGSSEVTTFLNTLMAKENSEIVPGTAIAQEAIKKAGLKSPVAESNWITVFGFPAAAASFIYTHFAQFGSILQSKCNPGGNWLHIKYASIIQARRALSCNGKVLGGTIMVGVITSPREVIEQFEKTDPDHNQSGGSEIKSPLQEKNLPADSSSSSRSTGIKPLAGSQLTSPVFSASDKGSSVTASSNVVSPSATFTSSRQTQNENVPLPQPSSGILTKAMEYMFGW